MLTRFFIRHFLTFIIPISIPVIIFSIMAMDVFQDTLRNDIDSSTNRSLNMSKSTIELLFSDMNSNKILIDYNPKLILTLLKILNDDGEEASYEDTEALKHIYPFLKSASYSRLYINSIYIKLGNGSHFLANGDKVRIADYFDTTWYDSFENQHPDTELWTEKRRIYNQDVVSIYQRTKLNGVIVINVLPEYFNNMLDSITTHDNQTIMVLNENKQLIFSNTEHLSEDVVNRYVNESSSDQKDVFEINNYHVLEMPSEHYAFTYVSFIPNSTVYKIPNLIMKLSFFSILVSVIISFVLAYYFSRRNYKQISNIIQTFKLAKLGKPITEVVERKNDVYSLLLSNTINTIVDQSNTKIQLSERRYRQVVAELVALQYQINPHFLFNTLQSINFEILNITQKPIFVNTMIEHLSEILRYSLDNPLHMANIGEEIEFTKKYIDIQRYRFDENFDVTWDYDEDILEHKTLRLLLQPIIENSINYGVGQEGTGFCHVRIYRAGSDIQFEVTDNGPGMTEERLNEVISSFHSEPDYEKVEHIGLRNINARLKLKYGDDNSLVIGNVPNSGVSVSFKVRILESI